MFFSNFKNILVSELSKVKESFSESWLTRKRIFYIFLRVYMTFSYIKKSLCSDKNLFCTFLKSHIQRTKFAQNLHGSPSSLTIYYLIFYFKCELLRQKKKYYVFYWTHIFIESVFSLFSHKFVVNNNAHSIIFRSVLHRRSKIPFFAFVWNRIRFCINGLLLEFFSFFSYKF